MRNAEPPSQRARTKIVATVGPACHLPDQLEALVRGGADVFRLNMAHGNRGEHEETIRTIRELSQRLRPLAILVDLAGPKIRLGKLASDPLDCPAGSEFQFVRGDHSTSPAELVSTYERLVDELSVGDDVILADGTVSMVVMAKQTDAVVCQVINPGAIRSRQGINLPGAKLTLPALTDHDLDCAVWAARQQIDFVSLSFVRSPTELHRLRSLLREHDCSAPVIAKIERREALSDLERIVAAADAVMVARGDLGVEIDVAEVAAAQKRIIATCNRLQRPVIVATQMLDSMQTSPRPTRAEVTDVANAILDGADAGMLSGETAVGAFPCQSVQMMNRIMISTEQLLRDRPPRPLQHSASDHVSPITQSLVWGAGQIAARLDAKLVVIATRSGNTALAKSAQRDFVPTVAVTNDVSVLRRMCLYWGITPLPNAPCGNDRQLRDFIFAWGREEGSLTPGDRVVVLTGTHIHPVAHNVLVVHEVDESGG